MNDILHISMENWEGVWRRNQNVAAHLARRFPDRSILYVNLARDVSHALRSRDWNELKPLLRSGLRPSPPVRLSDPPNVWTFTPLKLWPNTLRAGRLANQRSLRRQVRAAMRTVGLRAPFLYVNPYYAAHMVGRMGERGSVYDIGEDWTAFAQGAREGRLVAADDEWLSHHADALVVVSPALQKLKSAARPDVHLIPNGVDVERYSEVAARTLEPHPLAQGWTRPVLGHTGTLHSQRTDAPLLARVAQAFPQATVALVGPSHLNGEDEALLRACPNVRLCGAVPYDEVPRVMSAFDVCLVPQQVTPFSESQNPLKLFEYLAAGLPIVSTPVSGFREFSHLIHLGATPDEFIAAIHTALHEAPGVAEARRREAQHHTWAARVDDLVGVYEEVERRRAPVAR